jgi:hypothetical protein
MLLVEGKTKPTINEEVLDNLGVIEVVVLRCEDDPASIPKNPWTFPILPSIPPPARKVSSTGAAPGQSTRKTRASSSEADENGDDALGGMFGLFDGAGDEPPRRYRRHFGDIAEWSASVAPPSPARIYHSREPEIADDATRTSMVSSNGYHHMPGAFHSAESDAATHGAERDSADRYRSRTVHVRTLEGGLDYCYDREEPQQTRITSSPQARELRRGVSERAPGSPRPRHIGLRFESPQRYSRRDEVDQRIPRHAEDEKPFAAPTTRHRRKTVEIIDDQVDNHEKLLLRGRRKIDEHSGHEYVAPGRKTSGEFPNMQPQGKLKDGPELNYPAVDIHSPYGRVNVGYGSKYLAARDARRRDLEPKAQLQPPPWQPSIPPPPSHPARYIEEERADLINTEWRPTRSTSGPLYPAHRDTLYHPPAPPLSYIVPALIKPSNKARTTAKKIAKLEGQLHKLRADSAPLHLPYARCPSGWHQGYPVPGNGSMYHQHLNFAPSWHGGFSTRTQRSSSASSGTTRSAIDDVGEASKKDSGDDVAMVGGEISNNATNSNDDSNNNNQTSATSGWGQNTTNNDNSGSANQPINSGWQNQTDQNNDTPQQNGDWDSNNNQSNDNNASGNNDWNNTPDNNNQQQYSNQDWNNGQDDNNRDNNNNNGDNGWNSRQSGQNQDSTSEKSQDQKRSRAGSNIKDEEKPYTRSYWHAQVPTDRSRDRANSSRKRETFSMPEDPIYTISKDEAEARKLKHQVRGGRGTEKQNKLGAKPLYWDNLEAPYAVFRFKYRSKGKTMCGSASMFPRPFALRAGDD